MHQPLQMHQRLAGRDTQMPGHLGIGQHGGDRLRGPGHFHPALLQQCQHGRTLHIRSADAATNAARQPGGDQSDRFVLAQPQMTRAMQACALAHRHRQAHRLGRARQTDLDQTTGGAGTDGRDILQQRLHGAGHGWRLGADTGRDIGHTAQTLATADQTLVSQLLQGLARGDARHAIELAQFALRGQQTAGRPDPGQQVVSQCGIDLVIQRRQRRQWWRWWRWWRWPSRAGAHCAHAGSGTATTQSSTMPPLTLRQAPVMLAA